jgi:proton glutamate symport protein
MKNNVLFKVFLAIVLAILAGWITGPNMEIFGVTFVRIYGLIGQLFLNALTLVVVPLVSASIITGTARMGTEQSFGKLGAKTFGYYLGTSTLAILVGLFFVLLISPGTSQEHFSFASSVDATRITTIAEQSSGDGFDKISQILFKLVPSNILAVASQGQMLGLIFFSLIFGFFITKIDEQPGSIILGFWRGIFQIMMRITRLVMMALPIGVFGLVAKVVATTGLEAAASVALFTVTILVSLLAYALIVLPLLLFFVAGVNPVAHIRAMAPALFTAFSTSSSAAALPITIECIEKRVGISNRICSFTIPLGSSINVSGSALYICVSAIFIAQAYGVDLSPMTLALIVIMSLLTSVGVAGIPSACLISLVIILNTIGVPAEGIGLILAMERILDMCRTVVNVFGNTCCSVLIARSQGEQILVSAPQPLQKASD